MDSGLSGAALMKTTKGNAVETAQGAAAPRVPSFTSGPWEPFEGTFDASITANGAHVAICKPRDVYLIAAAPDLLAAVQELLSYPSGQYGESPDDDYDGACERANAAIAKALEVRGAVAQGDEA